MPLIVKANRDLHDPRGDVSDVAESEIQRFVSRITDVLQWGHDEFSVADALREIDLELQSDSALYMCVSDRLRDTRIITKAHWRAYLDLRRTDERDPNLTHW